MDACQSWVCLFRQYLTREFIWHKSIFHKALKDYCYFQYRVLNPGPPALAASTLPLGYWGDSIPIESVRCFIEQYNIPSLFMVHINLLTISTSSQSEIPQKDLDNLERWSHKWDMEFNPSKCQVIHITRSKKTVPTQYTLHNCILEYVSSATYLGVDISSDL